MTRTIKTILFISSLAFAAMGVWLIANTMDQHFRKSVDHAVIDNGSAASGGFGGSATAPSISVEMPIVIRPDRHTGKPIAYCLVTDQPVVNFYVREGDITTTEDGWTYTCDPVKGLQQKKPDEKPGKLSVICEYPGCSGRLQTTGPAITTKPGSIANTGTIGSVTISTYPTGTVSVYSSNSPVCRIHPDEEITGVVGICDEKRAAEDAMKQYVPLENK